MYKRYRHAGSTIKIINILGNTDKKTPKEDSELGYLDFTLALTFHLPHPQKKDMQLSQILKIIQNNRVIGEANLRCKAPSINKIVDLVSGNPLSL